MSLRNSDNEWICLQPGVRNRYATARAMLQYATLRLMITDYWAGSLVRRMRRRLPKMAFHFNPEIPPHLVRSFNLSKLAEMLYDRLRPPHDRQERYRRYVRQHAAFARRSLRVLRAMSIDPTRSVYHTFNTTAAGPIRFMKDRGAVTIFEMSDVGETEDRIVAEEAERWPGWERMSEPRPEEYHQMIRRAQLESDVIVAISDWTRQHLVRTGIPEERIVVVPLAYEGETDPPDRPKQLRPDRKLRVLWLGHVILRKGFPYFVEAARRLIGERVEFLVAGRPDIHEEMLKNVPPNMRILGYAVRPEAMRLLRESDLFVLPTLSDGFALTQLEAMSHGLPVIATPNCGQVVTDGEDGFIIPIRDSQTLVDRIMAYVNDPDLLPRHSQATQVKIRQFTLERYARELNAAVDRFRTTGAAAPGQTTASDALAGVPSSKSR